jgi:SNARE protein
VLQNDIQFWKDTIKTDIEAIEATIQQIPTITDALERTSALDIADKKLRTVKSNTRTFKAEVRLLSDANERTKYKKELSHYETTTAQLTADLRNLRSEGTRQQLFLGATPDETGEMDPQANGDALLKDAERIQDKTQQSLHHTKKMVAESKEVAVTTVEELQRQREQIQKIDTDVMEMESELVRADRLIKTFGKRMATDKLIQCFACMNLLMIVGVVIYVVVKGGLDGNEKDAGRPDSPVGDSSTNTDTVSANRFLRGALGW